METSHKRGDSKTITGRKESKILKKHICTKTEEDIEEIKSRGELNEHIMQTLTLKLNIPD